MLFLFEHNTTVDWLNQMVYQIKRCGALKCFLILEILKNMIKIKTETVLKNVS